jgi:hypothetical protein
MVIERVSWMVLGLVLANITIAVIKTTIAIVTISTILKIMNVPCRLRGLGIESIVESNREG